MSDTGIPQGGTPDAWSGDTALEFKTAAIAARRARGLTLERRYILGTGAFALLLLIGGIAFWLATRHVYIIASGVAGLLFTGVWWWDVGRDVDGE